MSPPEKHGERGGTTEDKGTGRFVDGDGSIRLVISQDDLQSVASLFGRIVALRQGGQSSRRDEGRDEGAPLDAHVRVVMRTMKQRLALLENGPLQDAEVVMAMHSLYSICIEELILITDEIHPGLSGALKQLRGAHDSLLQEVPGIVKRTLYGYKQEVTSLREDKEREAREAKELVQAAQALERETVAHHQELRQLHRRLKELKEENAWLKNNHAAGRCSLPPRPRSPQCQNNTCGMIGAIACARKTPFSDGSSASCHNCHHRTEERTTPERWAENVRTVGFSMGPDGGGVAEKGKAAAGAAAVVANGSKRELSLKQLHDLIASVYASKEKYDLRCASQRLPSQTLARHLDDFLTHRYGLTTMAKVQAAALRKGIEKFRDNDNAVKVFELTLRNEVDEAFRLEQRGLERAVVDCIRARIRERTIRHDKITTHEDRYSYRRSAGISRGASSKTISGTGNQGQAGGSGGVAGPIIGDARAYSGVVAAAASTANIESLLRSQTRPGARLATADWAAVVRHVYKGSATADAQTAGFLVKEAVSTLPEVKRRRGHEQPGSGRGAGGKGPGQGQRSVPFGVFLQVLLEYQLHGYLRRWKLFREDFREVDVDGDDILNPAQFLTLAKRLLRRAQRATPSSQPSPSRKHDTVGFSARSEANGVHYPMVAEAKDRPNAVEQQAVARLRAADPHGFGSITYSQCVLHLASICGGN